MAKSSSEPAATTNALFKVKRFFVGSLVLADFSTNMMDFLVSVFLVDIAAVFLGSASASNVGYVSTLLTISNIVSFVFGLLLGYLCSKIRYKILLMAGLLCVSVGAIGCSFAPSFLALQIFYPLDGVGTVLISSMAYALAGENLPLNKKAKAVGYIVAGSPISGLVGSFVISLFFGQSAGWRSFMLFYVLPISVISLAVVYFNVPSVHSLIKDADKQTLKQKLRQVFPSKNAAACLAGNFCRYLATAWTMFGIAFTRTSLGLSAAMGAAIILIGNIGIVFGMILAGHLVNRTGRKRLVSASVFCLGLLMLVFIWVVSLGYTWIAVGVWLILGFVGGLNYTSSINFTLEQAPKARGPLMSVNSAFIYLGVAVGGAIGGIVLSNFNYQAVGYTFTIFLFASFAIYLFLTKETCHNSQKASGVPL